MAESTSPAFEIEIGGKKTVVRLDDFDGREVKLCRGETGHPPRYWFQHTDEMDIDVIAAFVWLTRRRAKPNLTYDEVLDGINYSNVNVVTDAEDDPEDEDSPEG